MSIHLVLLSQQPPDGRIVIDELARLLPEALIDQSTPPVMQVRDAEGRLVLSVEAPSVVEVPGEAERLLGAQSLPLPYYWTELRGNPASAGVLAQLGRSLADRLGGHIA